MEPAAAAGGGAEDVDVAAERASHRRRRRCRIYDMNEHLLCALCSGYLVDATAIIECLHTCKLRPSYVTAAAAIDVKNDVFYSCHVFTFLTFF